LIPIRDQVRFFGKDGAWFLSDAVVGDNHSFHILAVGWYVVCVQEDALKIIIKYLLFYAALALVLMMVKGVS